MRHPRPIVTGLLLFGVAVTVAQAAEPPRSATTRPAVDRAGDVSDTPGQLLGTVTNSEGIPLEATLVSASGPHGTALAVCDAEGRYEFRQLAPGRYLLRAHRTGYSATERYIIEVKPGLSTQHAIQLRAVSRNLAAPFFRAGGLVPLLHAAGQVNALDGDTTDGLDEVEDGANAQDGGTSSSPHNHSEKAWRLRRARRSVLKDSDAAVQLVRDALSEPRQTPATGFGSAAAGMRASADSLMGLPVSGQLHLLTRATIHTSGELLSMDVLPGQVAYVSVGAPTKDGQWGVRGAVTAGDSGSWVLAGSYHTETSDRHSLGVGMSYSRQRAHLQGSAEPVLGPAGPEHDRIREAGSVRADGTWVPLSRVLVGYGASVAQYGYLDDGRLFSPRAAITVQPMSKTRVRFAISQHALAPGAEEFLPPASGVWLPPERTFAPLSPTTPLEVERARHLEVAVERDLGSRSVVGISRFHQDVSNQMITMFGSEPTGNPAGSASHYYLTNANGLTADGWGVSFSHEVADRVRGAVAYSVTQATWAPWSASMRSPEAARLLRVGTEQFHDVTTSVETEIPETATRVLVLCRVNTAFSRAEAESLASGLDARFAVRVKQTLPFAPFGDSDWEVLVDVRSLFREQAMGASVYDELLVVSPPKQFVGGLVVHF